MMRALGHVLRVTVSLFLLVGLPLLLSPTFRGLLSGDTDAVSSATAAIEQPSGEYAVIINTALHTDEAALAAWRAFFEQGDSEGMINVFEDVSCTVAANDPNGLEAARSFMSRLPENQMKIRTEDITLMLSKAENGRFDVIVMSRELADSAGAERICSTAAAEMYISKGESAQS